MKKILSLFLVFVLCIVFMLSPSAMIDESVITNPITASSVVYSSAFPNAYILQEVSFSKTQSNSILQTVSATVFVEETYGLDADGNPIVLSSRLLSENEVMSIGIANFGDVEDSQCLALDALAETRAATNSRGKLTITFEGEYTVSGNSVTADVSGHANWSDGALVLGGSSRPAVGSDYIGVIWSGEFSCTSSNASYVSSSSTFDTPPVFAMAYAFPNVGRVWEFNEYWTESFLGSGGGAVAYLTDIYVDLTLTKNTMTGNGNTAEVVMQYIHTYGSADGSISLSPTELGISLSGVINQWGLACVLTGVPY